MKTILVTGVAGFIGSNLTEALLERGYEIIGLDDLSQGFLRNLGEFHCHPGFEFHQGDVRDSSTVAGLVVRADCVVHLAAFKIPRYGNALDTLLVNVHGARNVLRQAARRNVRVILASTSDVYGRNPNVPFNEQSDLVMGPSSVKRWAYAVSKMYNEHLCFAARVEHDLPVVVVRFFGGYGPRQNTTWWGGPQAVFITAALRDEPMEVHGDGTQTRSFTYVTDHVDGLIRCIERDEATGEIFNLGSTEEISIIDLATSIWRLCGRGDPKVEFVPYSAFGKYQDVARRVPDISKASRVLGFAPQVRLQEGLERTIAWQRSLVRT